MPGILRCVSKAAETASSIPLEFRSVSAFIGRTERGPINEAVRIRSFEQYKLHFGGEVSFSCVPQAVQQYFQQGGQEAVVVRVANRATRAGFAIPAGDEFLYLQARQPGRSEFIRVSVDLIPDTENLARFSLVVQRMAGAASSRIVDQELHTSLSMNPADQDFIAERLRRSQLVRLNVPLPASPPDATVASRVGAPIPYIAARTPGSDGEALSDYDLIGSNVERTGLFALDRIDRVDFVCLPPSPGTEHGVTTFLAAERYCEQRRALLIWDPPRSWVSPQAAVQSARDSSLISRNAVTYYPRPGSRAPGDACGDGLPACGAIAGAMAARAARGVWNDSDYEGIKGSLASADALDDAESAALKRCGVNILRGSDGSHYDFRGGLTLAGDPSDVWRNLNRRRLMFFILDSMERATRWVPLSLFESTTERELDRSVRQFLMGLHEQGALAGHTPAQAFHLGVDRPGPDLPATIRLRLGIALRRPGEFLRYEFIYEPDRQTVRRAPAQEAEQLAV